jgi:type IV secretory pathway VirJ component
MELPRVIALPAFLITVMIALGAPPANEQTVSFGRFKNVAIYRTTPRPSHVVLFVSGDGGWNQGVVDMARELASLDALVAGIDITSYLKELASSDEKCSYPASDFEELSQFIQKTFDYPSYVTPILVGYSSGATLVYAILAQAPSNSFRGALSLGFCPDLLVNKPFCPGRGLASRPGPRGKGIVFLPTKNLEVPFIALQGTIDQVCYPESTVAFVHHVTNGRVVVLPKVGHGYSVPKNWMPQMKESFSAIATSIPVDAPIERTDDLSDLPLNEVPAAAADSAAGDPPQASSRTMVVHITGDGGWGVTDKGLSAALAADGVPVVGLNALHYFWHAKTPEGSAQDLARIIEHYSALWDRPRVVLIGYSFGADALPFMFNRLPTGMRSRIPLIVLLGPSREASFHFRLPGMGSGHGDGDYPVPSEISKIEGSRILCFSGEEDKGAICNDLDSTRVTSVSYGGGHRIGHRFDDIAARIIQAIR